MYEPPATAVNSILFPGSLFFRRTETLGSRVSLPRVSLLPKKKDPGNDVLIYVHRRQSSFGKRPIKCERRLFRLKFSVTHIKYFKLASNKTSLSASERCRRYQHYSGFSCPLKIRVNPAHQTMPTSNSHRASSRY